MSLYPLKFRPRLVEKIWGGRKFESLLGKPLPAGKPIGESWEIYDFPPGVIDSSGQWVSAEIANGPLAGRTLHWAVQEYGRALYGDVPLWGEHGQFPVLVKFLDAREHLSLQVHPTEAYAKAHPGACLKTEAWYVVESEPGAKLWRGIRPGTTPEQFKELAPTSRFEEVVNAVPAKAGHCFYLPSGTVHALGAGIVIAEVQTPSDTTFRIYDFDRVESATGRPRTLHVEEAMACIDFGGKAEPPQPRSHVAGYFTTVSRLVTSPFFKMEKVRMTEGVEEPVPYDEPVVWIVLEGKAQVKVEGMREPVTFGKGETVLLPAEMRNPVIKTVEDCVWLEVTFPTKPEVE